jgi:hypothetical protein
MLFYVAFWYIQRAPIPSNGQYSGLKSLYLAIAVFADPFSTKEREKPAERPSRLYMFWKIQTRSSMQSSSCNFNRHPHSLICRRGFNLSTEEQRERQTSTSRCWFYSQLRKQHRQYMTRPFLNSKTCPDTLGIWVELDQKRRATSRT